MPASLVLFSIILWEYTFCSEIREYVEIDNVSECFYPEMYILKYIFSCECLANVV